MSKSRSATPKPNTVITVAAPPSKPPHPSNPPVSPVASGSTSRVHPAEDRDNQPLPKRMRYGESEQKVTVRGRARSLSSQSTSSQGEMADTEVDTQKSQEVHHSVPAPPPPKKKRTRTLTTPHQSAVLHALLAESRFPTTAMREEVGRSIGLSARKVQIWFQNQRQKARRPRSQSAASLTRPQQYGPFPVSQESLTGYSFVSDQGRRDDSNPGGDSVLMEHPYSSSLHGNRGADRSSKGEHRPPSPPFLGSGSQLVGPGMPGSPMVLQRGFSPLIARGLTALSVPSSAAPPRSAPLESDSRLFPEPGATGSRSRPSTVSALGSVDPLPQVGMQSRERALDLERTLPPLPFDLPLRRSTSSARGLHHATRSVPSISQLSDSPFSYHPPEPSTRTSDLVLNPPFTLQPTPQWVHSSFSAISTSRPPSSWEHPDNAYSKAGERSFAPVRDRPNLDWAPGHDPLPSASTGGVSSQRGPVEPSHTSESEREATPRLESTVPAGSRFDPVRSAFIPYNQPQPRSGGATGAANNKEPKGTDD